MAASTSIHGPIIQSTPCDVHWCGFVADTRRLAANGWEMAVEADPIRRYRDVLLRHNRTGWMMRGSLDEEMFRCAAMRYSSWSDRTPHEVRPQIEITSATCDHKTYFSGPIDFTRVSLEPGVIHDVEQWRGDTLGLFTPWIDKSQEIIVAPETVSELFERIKALQSPELAAIRERNRARDMREKPASAAVVAQVIQLAA